MSAPPSPPGFFPGILEDSWAGRPSLSDLVCPDLQPASPETFHLTHAVRSLDVAKVRVLLEEQPMLCIEEKDPVTGRTPLHWACLLASYEIVSLLLQTETLVNSPELSGGWTPLHLSVLTLNPALCELLLTNGGDPEILDRDHKSCVALVGEIDNEALNDVFRRYHEDPHCFLKNGYRRKRAKGLLLGNLPPFR